MPDSFPTETLSVGLWGNLAFFIFRTLWKPQLSREKILHGVALQGDACGMGDPEVLKERYGKQLTFYSNLCNQSILPHGTPDEVWQDVSRKIRAWVPAGDTSCRQATTFRPTCPRRTFWQRSTQPGKSAGIHLHRSTNHVAAARRDRARQSTCSFPNNGTSSRRPK